VAIIDGIKGIGRAIKYQIIKEGRRLKTLPGGIDIGSESHHVIIMDDNGKILVTFKSCGIMIFGPLRSGY